MPRKNNRRRPRARRSVARVSNFSGFGSTQSFRFTSLLTRYNLSTAAAGINSNLITVAGFIGGDLNLRFVKPVSIMARFHCYNQATTSGSHYSAQLQYSDFNNANLIPISPDKPLSSTNTVVLRGVFPFIADWISANSATNMVNVSIWAQSVLSTGLYVDFSVVWVVARDVQA